MVLNSKLLKRVALFTGLTVLNVNAANETQFFKDKIKPLLSKYCQECHGADKAKSNIRVDVLSTDFTGQDIFVWEKMHHALTNEEDPMPPEDEEQPAKEDKKMLTDWVDAKIRQAKLTAKDKNGSVRRLTKSQYQNTLNELLGLEDKLASVLPNDAISKDGFSNNGADMQLSPLQMEYYFNIARKALDLTIVDENKKPLIQSLRMDLGKNINTNPNKDRLILGAGNRLVPTRDFTLTELDPKKPFGYEPFRLQQELTFIEGYTGNGTVRKNKDFKGLNHSVFACLRGKGGHPHGDPSTVIDNGILLRSSIPTSGIFGKDSTMGPSPNFKLAMRARPANG